MNFLNIDFLWELSAIHTLDVRFIRKDSFKQAVLSGLLDKILQKSEDLPVYF